MTHARNLAGLIAGAALLAACSKPAGAGGHAEAQASPAAGGGSSSSSSELPSLKFGLWEIHMAHAGGGETHSGVTQQCMSAEAEAEAKKTAADYVKANCSKNEITGGNGRWVSDLVCKAGASTMTTHSVTTLTGEDAYHTEVTTAFDPPVGGNGANTSTLDGRWIGPCKPT